MRPDVDPKAEQNRKLFVGGLHPKTDEDSLRTFYKQWGEITDVVVMRDPKSTKSRGFGFVTYATDQAVDDAQRNRPHMIDGKEVDSKRAMPRDETNPDVHAPVKKIFVGRLKKEMTNADLESFFSRFGKVTEATVVMAKDTNTSRGFAFVTFDDNDAVDKVILGRPLEINGHRIDVRKAVDRAEANKMRQRQPPRDNYNYGWGDAANPAYPPQQAWDQSGYQQYYGSQAAPPQQAYGNAGYGYGNYDANASAGSWQGGANDSFGSYPQQAYAGGPMRANPPAAQQYNRPAPYNGNGWSQR